MTCSTMAIEAIRKIDDEYLTAAAGPTSHSPPPIDVAAMIAPGPITFSRLRSPNGGGAGRSSTSHGESRPWPGGRDLSRESAALSADGIGRPKDSALRPPLRQSDVVDCWRAKTSVQPTVGPTKVGPYCDRSLARLRSGP